MKFVREYETDTAIYRHYVSEDGSLRMETVSQKATADLPAAGYVVRLPRPGPGNAAAVAAFKQGLEDEYIDGMKSRYGGEW